MRSGRELAANSRHGWETSSGKAKLAVHWISTGDRCQHEGDATMTVLQNAYRHLTDVSRARFT